jgi:dihydroneopterin aldolase
LDRIEIRGLRAFGYHGVLEDEQRHGQSFVVDLVLERELVTPAASDALAATVDYAGLAQRVGEAIAATRFALIEALAAHLADLALEAPGVEAVTVRVSKPEAPLSVHVDEVAVVLHRTAAGAERAGP